PGHRGVHVHAHEIDLGLKRRLSSALILGVQCKGQTDDPDRGEEDARDCPHGLQHTPLGKNVPDLRSQHETISVPSCPGKGTKLKQPNWRDACTVYWTWST